MTPIKKKEEVSQEVTETISKKVASRKPLDQRIEDLRHKILYLNPYSGWIPKDVRQRIVNVVDGDGEIVGELEEGSDGFVQLALVVDRSLVRVSLYPGRNHAIAVKTAVGP